MFESDQHLFNKHIRCSKSSVELENGGSPSLPYIHSLKECRIIDIGYSGHAPPRQRILLMNISREVFNAFPSHPSPWGLMGLPLGDERNDSLIIHFAGVYGGISEENGRPNYLATLLAVKGFIDRHLRFLLSSQQLRSIDNGRASKRHLVDLPDAIRLMNQASALMGDCIARTFSLFKMETAEARAADCMAQVRALTSQLLTNQTRKKIFSCRKNIVVF
eukprot:gene22942-31247_t